MFHATVAVLLGSDFFLLLFLYLRYASPFVRLGTSLILLRSTPLLIGCRPLLSLSSLPPSPSLSPPLRSSTSRLGSSSSLPPPFLVLCHTFLGGFSYPISLLLPTRRRLPLLFFRLPAASSSFSFPHFPLTFFRSRLIPLPVPAPCLSQAPTSGRLLPPRGFALFRGGVWVVLRLLWGEGGFPLPLSYS